MKTCSTAIAISTCCGLLVTALGAGEARAAIEHRTVPYHGYLENGGQPVNGPVSMTFRFFSVPTEGEAIAGADVVIDEVQVSRGVFTALLPLADAVLDAEDVYVEVEVGGAILAGRQRIYAAPYAMRGLADGEFKASNVTVGETLSANTLESRGADLVLGVDDGRSVGSNERQRALVHHDGDLLVVNHAGDFEGGTKIDSNLEVVGGTSLRDGLSVAGDATVTGNTNVTGDLTVAGSITNLSFSSVYLAERHNSGGSDDAIMTPHDSSICFLTKVEMEDLDSGGEAGRCEIIPQAGNWLLRASLGSTSDADVICEARCLSW